MTVGCEGGDAYLQSTKHAQWEIRLIAEFTKIILESHEYHSNPETAPDLDLLRCSHSRQYDSL